MSDANNSGTTATPQPHAGLELLRLYAQLEGLNLDGRQLAHHFVQAGQAFGMVDMVRALQGLDFKARKRTGAFKALATAHLPLLAQCRDGSFMLVGRIDRKKDDKKDRKPGNDTTVIVQQAGARAPRQLTHAEFAALWSGDWIDARRAPRHRTRAAGPEADADVDTIAGRFGIGWFWNALGKYRGLLGQVLLASFFVQVFALASPLIFQVVVDKVLTHRSLTTLDVMIVALLCVSLFEVVLASMRHYLLTHTTNRVDVELGAALFRHLLHLPLSYFESRRAGDTVARMRELENARNVLTGSAMTAWLDLFFALVFLAVMVCYSATLALIVVAALPVFFAASWVVTPILRAKLEDKFMLGAENQSFLVETITAMETIKAQAVEPQWQRDWERRLASHVSASFEGGHLASATNQFIGLASKLLSAVLLWFGARLVIDGDLSVGGLIAFNMLASRINAPILKLASVWQDITQMKVSMRRLADIMDAPAEPAFQPERMMPPDVRGAVRFENVSFRYHAKRAEVLADLSFEVAPGEVIGLVGVSGCGKTTLMRLMQRLYAPERGRVLIDGVDLSLVDAAWLRRQIGVVAQDTLLFNRSVRDNIALADPDLPVEAIIEAARLAGAHDFIMAMPDGYDSIIGERGGKLSGGQRARIAIARALAVNPRLLLLDEATAALDYESERVIHDNLARICQGRTVFIAAHRLPTLRLTDRILVLEQGRLIESGTHAALIARGGRYRDLYRAHQVMDRDMDRSDAPAATGRLQGRSVRVASLDPRLANAVSLFPRVAHG